ncbi:hypothetical protein FRC10_009942 [Ceratobasidium sp. 414]|nr:hypothetical protein FRC10_009942 [Ceratobasidium sp. 414]
MFLSMSMTITSPTSPPAAVPTRQLTKKWSFSNALNLRLPSGFPKDSLHKDPHGYVGSPQKTPRSQNSVSFSAGPIDTSSPAGSGGGSSENWSAVEHSEAADFAPSSAPTAGNMGLARTPEASGFHYSKTPEMVPHSFPRTLETATRNFPKTPEGLSHVRTPDASSVSSASTLDTSTTQQAVSSPSAKQPRRLTPSSIPFFRRSSSHSMQVQHNTGAYHRVPQAAVEASSHSVSSLASESGFSQSGFSGVSGPPSASKKSSVLNLGSLLKGSGSRKSAMRRQEPYGQVSRGEGAEEGGQGEEREPYLSFDGEEEKEGGCDWGELNGFGNQTISSAEDKRGSKTVALPPVQMSVLPASTVQRVANLKVTGSPLNHLVYEPRQHLPTIAGSPSVGLGGQQPQAREGVSAMSNATITKDTPTKIPYSRRTSLNITGLSAAQQAKVQAPSRDGSPSGQSSNANEFGMVSPGDTPKPQYATIGAMARSSVRASPQSSARALRQSNAGKSSSSSSATPSVAKKSTNPVSLSSLRKFSNNSTSASAGSASNAKEIHHSRLSILSPSKSLKFLSPKVTLPITRSAEPSPRGVTPATPSSSRQSLSTPSPVPMEVDEEELAGDEEMMAYIRRLHARKLASGAK